MIMQQRLSKWLDSNDIQDVISPLIVDENDQMDMTLMSKSKRKKQSFEKDALSIIEKTRQMLSKIHADKDGSVIATITTDVWDDEKLETSIVRNDDDYDELDALIDMFERTYSCTIDALDALFKAANTKDIMDRYSIDNSYTSSCLKTFEMIALTATRLSDAEAFSSALSCIAQNTRLLEHIPRNCIPSPITIEHGRSQNSLSTASVTSPNIASTGSSSSILASLSSFLTFGTHSNVTSEPPTPNNSSPIAKSRQPNKSIQMTSHNIECIKLLLRLVHSYTTLLTARSWSYVMRCVARMETLPDSIKPEFLVMQASVDTLFVKSTSLSRENYYAFIEGLCSASKANLISPTTNKRYGLDKLLEVTYFNMSRDAIDRIEMWKRIGSHLVDALYICNDSNDTIIVTWIMDTMRQLAETFLEQNRISEQELKPGFARDVLMPFYDVIDRSGGRASLRDKIIMNCLGPIVMKRYNAIKSGWGCILKCIGRVVEFDPSDTSSVDMVEYLFDEYLSMMMVRSDYFAMITVNDSFVDLIECLATFAECPHAKQIAVYAIEFIAMCAQNLAVGRVTLNNTDEIIKLWRAICLSMCRIVCRAERVEIRHNAIEQLLNILRTHCIGRYDRKFWEEIFANTLLPSIKEAIERECKSSIIIREMSPVTPTLPKNEPRKVIVENVSDVRRCAALITEWIGMTLPRMIAGILNLMCDMYQQGTLLQQDDENAIHKQGHHLFAELVETICTLFVHEQRRRGELERYVVYNTKLAEIGADCVMQLLRRVGTSMTQDQWSIIRDHLRDLILVDTNSPAQVIRDRFIYDEDVFDVESKVHKSLIQVIHNIVFSYCEKGSHGFFVDCMSLDDILMFLEVVWSSYKGAQELHQELLSAQLHTHRISRQYTRMVHLRPRLIRHESITLTTYLEMLVKMLHTKDEPLQKVALELLMPLSRSLIETYLSSEDITRTPESPSPESTTIIPIDDDDHGKIDELQDLRISMSKDLVLAASPTKHKSDRIGSHKRSTSFHLLKKEKLQIQSSHKRRNSIHIESPIGKSNIENQVTVLYLREHMEHDSKMTTEMVNVIALILNGFLQANRTIFDEFITCNYESLTDLILSDMRAIREPLRAILARKRTNEE
jgi:hypothetical protein